MTLQKDLITSLSVTAEAYHASDFEKLLTAFEKDMQLIDVDSKSISTLSDGSIEINYYTNALIIEEI